MLLRSFICGSVHCKTEFRLISEEGEERYGKLLLEEPPLCPRCGLAILSPSFHFNTDFIVEGVTAKDLWLAVNGMGMPEEREFDHVQIIEMLTQYPIIYVSASMRGKGRVVLNHVVLSNGKKLHFSDGATIYKIEEDQDARQRTEL